MSWSYYRKVAAWTLLNATATSVIIWALGGHPRWFMAGFTQVPVTLTLYAPFEYYWTWSPEGPCVIN